MRRPRRGKSLVKDKTKVTEYGEVIKPTPIRSTPQRITKRRRIALYADESSAPIWTN